mmetsp:Transcript_28147/g.41578  ORF Transcript_28147/g.41578 Transcript_28147/m.41578 type:complete len:87 (+) Transcript_28147:648-908(+)
MTVILGHSVAVGDFLSKQKSSGLHLKVDATILVPSNRGSLCRGQGTILKSCGEDHKKLMIWGMKNRRSVLEKWPKIPTTANVIPLK